MSDRRELYQSSNGTLGFDPFNGGAVVVHEPNRPSGAQTSCIGVADFLRRGDGPERQALLASLPHSFRCRRMPTGPKGRKHPSDVVGNAIRVARIATGEAARAAKMVEAGSDQGVVEGALDNGTAHA